ncbi:MULTISPECIES: DUF2249 domain-containing protein [unclassified Devosia]|jgi:uncharacterized protein (DUF2249 family)|uniref:DUF2249 domain-containing protein n=1 Tax=unclassified Devosia TaxID=196773 RepID=UPI00086ECB15|nr:MULTISPECIES: DUF2249 domain-containing protein [unclassified Devosia]MBN9364231.1 DUF2249 domain-containing protein [Devosia sp.]ODS85149.1 MAG: hemerythrin [Devosia sp. SCN 66-27]OJX27460.1 MAG: hemerythrin [Devosia sp. 66-14]
MCKDCQPSETIIDLQHIAPRARHPLIFSTFENLGGGDSMLLLNDHDPNPLFYQLSVTYPGIFEWTYEETGPEVWKVRICRLVA